MLSTPPRLMPGASSSSVNTTGTWTVTVECSPMRRKSTCTGRSVTGSKATSLGSVRWPATVTFRTATLPTGGPLCCYLEADGLPRLLVEIEDDRVTRVASLRASQEETR